MCLSQWKIYLFYEGDKTVYEEHSKTTQNLGQLGNIIHM
jgi:hypothetical protein